MKLLSKNQVECKKAQREKIALQMAEYEAKNGPVKTHDVIVRDDVRNTVSSVQTAWSLNKEGESRGFRSNPK